MTVPNWWSAILLALAAYRVYRLLCCDVILDRPRERIVRRLKANAGGYRRELDVFLHCPWCLGFWVTGILLAGYCVATEWLGFFGFFVSWFAISTAVGLIQKLDQ